MKWRQTQLMTSEGEEEQLLLCPCPGKRGQGPRPPSPFCQKRPSSLLPGPSSIRNNWSSLEPLGKGSVESLLQKGLLSPEKEALLPFITGETGSRAQRLDSQSSALPYPRLPRGRAVRVPLTTGQAAATDSLTPTQRGSVAPTCTSQCGALTPSGLCPRFPSALLPEPVVATPAQALSDA